MVSNWYFTVWFIQHFLVGAGLLFENGKAHSSCIGWQNSLHPMLPSPWQIVTKWIIFLKVLNQIGTFCISADGTYQYGTRYSMILSSIEDPDPGSGAFLMLFWPRNPGWEKNPDPGSGMNIPDQISESFETIFKVKNTRILWCGSGSRIRDLVTLDPGSGMEKFGSGFR